MEGRGESDYQNLSLSKNMILCLKGDFHLLILFLILKCTLSHMLNWYLLDHLHLPNVMNIICTSVRSF